MTKYEFVRDIKTEELMSGDTTEDNEKKPSEEFPRRIFKFDGKLKDQTKIKLVAYSWEELYDKLPDIIRKKKKEGS